MKAAVCLRRSWTAFSACLLVSCGADPDPAVPPLVEDPTAYALPTMGSGGYGFGVGAAYPGALVPNGLVKVGPDTNGSAGLLPFLNYVGYWFGHERVEGFSHLHPHGTGLSDYGVLSFMPADGFDATRTRSSGYSLALDKGSEIASPGYYAVALERGIHVELTATAHAAHHRYSFSGADDRVVIIDLSHVLTGGEITDAEITVDLPAQEVSGRLHHLGQMSDTFGGYDVYFVARSRAPLRSSQIWHDGSEPAPGTSAAGVGVGAALFFDEAATAVELQVGVSLVSAAGARDNLEREMPAWDFEATVRAAKELWNARLAAIRVGGGSEADLFTFYSSLYHAFLMPTQTSDTDGARTFNGVTEQSELRFLSDMSLWDTYRTVHPLYALVAPDLARDSVRSLLAMYDALGAFPRWPLATGETGTMIGSSAEIVIADSYLRGVRDFDAALAYARLRGPALDWENTPLLGGRGMVAAYDRYGYVPATSSRSISQTLEYAQDDVALAGLAEALGEADDAAYLRERALGYRQLYDPESGFLRPRLEDGSILDEPFSPFAWDHYAEANAWQSLWAAHDIEGVVALLGGQEAFVARLSDLFNQSEATLPTAGVDDMLRFALPSDYYWAGNEPDLHVPYAFALAGRPNLTRYWVHWCMRTFYGSGPHGLAGNDDGGTLSAWFVWSALGLYPVAGTGDYIVGLPLFPRAMVKVGAAELEIVVEGSGPDWDVTLNGYPVTSPVLHHAEIARGGQLRWQ